jgi:hypothetical protein
MAESFVCRVCGQTHAGLPTDTAFKLPDEVWAIPEPQRSERAKFTADLCRFDGRYFIRCILVLPFTETGGDFAWGVWAEIAWPIFERYLSLYETDASAEPRHPGKLANALPTYDATLGLDVLLQFGRSKDRPAIHLPATDQSQLAREQRHGIDAARYHDILDATQPRR